MFLLDCLLQTSIYYCYFSFLSLAILGFILNKLPFQWYEVPTMLLEKVSMHTEIPFVHCYKLFFLCLLVLFPLFLLKILYYCLKVLMNLLCSCVLYIMVLTFYLFTQIFIIGHKGKTKFPEQKFCFRVHFFFSYKNIASKSFYKS